MKLRCEFGDYVLELREYHTIIFQIVRNCEKKKIIDQVRTLKLNLI